GPGAMSMRRRWTCRRSLRRTCGKATARAPGDEDVDMAEHDLDAVAFPKLDKSHLAALDRCPRTSLRRYRAGKKLFEAGDRDARFFIIKSGEVEIVDES